MNNQTYDTYDPILEMAEVRRPRPPLRTPAIGTTMVLERGIGEPLVVRHGERVPEPRFGNYRRMYIVDTGVHGLSFTDQVPSADPAFPFTVTISFACQIIDPLVIARDSVRNMTAALSPSLTTIVRRISVGFDLLQSAQAEAAITAALNSAHRDPAVLLTNFVAVVEATDTADIITARRELRVHGIRYDGMLPVAKGGRSEMLAHIMAMEGGDPTALLDREQNEREAHTAASLAALQMLMSSEKMEDFNTTRITEHAVTKFFPGDDALVGKKSGLRDRLERKRRGELEAGSGQVIEESAPSVSEKPKHANDNGNQQQPANGRQSSRLRGKGWSGDES